MTFDAEPSAPPTVSRLRRFLRRRIIRWALVVVALAVVVVVSAIVWVQGSGRGGIYDTADVPSRPVALVLGAGLRSDGTPTLYLARRLEIALDLYDRGAIRGVLASGDNSTTSYDEPSAMRDWLVSRGIPDDVVALDYAGFDTHDSCVRAREIFGVTAATVITQDYHLPRALFSCRRAGVDAVGVGASSGNGTVGRYRARELAASVKAAWDGMTHRKPKFLGPHEPALDGILTN
ncbi:SanA/YdcF family protein [Rarobacter faecitabidus]|nr:ElyC/SanA/YdcF family protein [Rarobacter faecitabidus]